MKAIWQRVFGYGVALAVSLLLVELLRFGYFVRALGVEAYVGLTGLLFLAVGTLGGIIWHRRRSAASAKSLSGVLESSELSAREQDVLLLIAQGLSNHDISARLSISINTTKTHVARIFEKLGAKRRTEAVARAREQNLLP